MEETHQEVVIRLREDLKREEEKSVHRAVSAVRAEEEEKQHKMMQEFRHKERERIQAAVDTEKRILESQQGSVTQLQKVTSSYCHYLEQVTVSVTQLQQVTGSVTQLQQVTVW